MATTIAKPVSQPFAKEAPLPALQKELRLAVPFGGALLRKLRQEGAENTFIRRPAKPDGPWLLRVKLPDDLQVRLALAPEVLVLVLGKTGVEARDLARCHWEIANAGPRLDSEVIVVVDGLPGLFGRLQRLDRRHLWIPWQPGRHGAELRFPSLAEQIGKQLPEHDIFEERDPVRGHQVIGRREAIRDLSQRLVSAKAVGVFGLRKVGKTTLVRAVTDSLDPVSSTLSMKVADVHGDLEFSERFLEHEDSARVLAVWLDCQKIISPSTEKVASFLIRQLRERLLAAQVSTSDVAGTSLERLGALLEHAAKASPLPVAVVLDEYDLLFEADGGKGSLPGLEQLFGLLRGHAQTTDKLSITVIGRDPEHFRQPKMNGVTNPMLAWFTPQWVGPLDRKGADELLSTLGRRVGLLVGKSTKDDAFEWTGGHPLLHRQYGSVLLDLARKTGRHAQATETDPFHEDAVEPFLERDAVTDICREVYDLLAARYPDAAAMLEKLALAPHGAGAVLLQEHGGFRGAAAKVLRNFGILAGTPEQPVLPGALRWYTKNVHPSSTGLSDE